MNTLIAYVSKYGTTEKNIQLLNEKLNNKAEVINLKKQLKINVDIYENVLIASPIYMGRPPREIKKFCNAYKNILVSKNIKIILCGMSQEEQAIKTFLYFLPKDLVKDNSQIVFFGGAFNFERMNWLDKLIVKKIARVRESMSNILEDNITKLANEILDENI